MAYTDKINKYGVKITAEQQRVIKNLTQTVNRQRERMLKTEQKMIEQNAKRLGGRPVFVESDFVLAKRSRGVQRFTTERQVEKYISSLKEATKPDYLEKRTNLYRDNYIKGVKNAIGSDLTPELEKKLKELSPEKFRELITLGELEPLEYYYPKEGVFDDRAKQEAEKIRQAIS